MDKTENYATIDFMKPENRLRATPIDLFKQGLCNRQWEAIEAAYIMLTGEVLPSNTKQEIVKAIPDKVAPIRDIEIPKQETINHFGIPTDCVAQIMDASKRKKFTKASQHDCRPRENRWQDDGSEASEEIVKDRAVPASLQTNRPPVTMIKVRCASCGKTDIVDPGQVPFGLKLTPKYRMRYLCNDCCVGAKSGIGNEEEIGNEPLYEEELIHGTTID